MARPDRRLESRHHMEKKRKFLFVSLTGLVGDIAWQVLKEGHEVRYFIGDEEEKDIADGFVPKTDDWEKDVDWADVIVFDDTLGQGEKAVALRARGKAVVGGTPYTDRLEDDRSFGQEELKKAGVTIIPYRDFDNFDEAIAYVQENPTRYVIKPSRRRRATSSGGSSSATRRTARTSSGCSRPTRRPSRTRSRSSSSRSASSGVEVAVGRLLQRQELRLSGQHQLRAQEALPRQQRAADRRDGHDDVLERAEQDLRADAPEDGAEPGRGGLRRLHRRQLHRQQQRDLPARVHVALRLPDDLHPAGGHDHADRPLPLGPRARPRPEAQGQERLPGRRADRHAAVPLRRQRDLRVLLDATPSSSSRRARPRRSTSRTSRSSRASGSSPGPRASCSRSWGSARR